MTALLVTAALLTQPTPAADPLAPYPDHGRWRTDAVDIIDRTCRRDGGCDGRGWWTIAHEVTDGILHYDELTAGQPPGGGFGSGEAIGRVWVRFASDRMAGKRCAGCPRPAPLDCIAWWETERRAGFDKGYMVETGNGYSGRYQFDALTWADAVSRAGWPEFAGQPASTAPSWAQDVAAWQLYLERGLQPWPTPAAECS